MKMRNTDRTLRYEKHQKRKEKKIPLNSFGKKREKNETFIRSFF